MRFKKYGKTYQLRIETAEDLERVLHLDESLWVATSAPRDAFRCDPRFLLLVDSDANGRIYTEELKAAIVWLLERLADPSCIHQGADALPLASIRSDTAEGQALLRSARYVIESQAEDSGDTISMAHVTGFTANILSRPLNGDGVIVPEAAGDPAVAGFISDVIACVAATEDAGGKKGITESHLDQFMAAVSGYIEWKMRSEIPSGQTSTPLMPLGEDTPPAYGVLQARAGKIDGFFALCRAIRFEPRVADLIGWPGPDQQGLDPADLQQLQASLEQAPLAQPSHDGMLPLAEEDINPTCRQWIADLKEHVLRPVLGAVPERLSESDWQKAKSLLSPYAAYLKEKRGAEVEALPIEKLEQYRDGDLEKQVRVLIAADREVAATLAGVEQLERLLLYHQHLMRLVKNFVSFPELYDTGMRALFEMGSAVIDGRWFNFAVKVDNVAAHMAMARASNIFTLYLEVTGAPSQEKFVVAVPVTSGAKGNLGIGKQGVFFDTAGKEYDAKVVQLIENPVSVREALVVPFVRLWRFVTGKIESFSSKAQTTVGKGLDGVMTDARKASAQAAKPGAPAPAPAAPAGTANLFMGVSVAIAALGSAFAFIMKTLVGLWPWPLVLGVAGAVLAVMIPISIVAVMKLRRQDLSAILEGCGWAINARMRLSGKQRRSFTVPGAYPEKAEGVPTVRKGRTVVLLVLLILALGAYCAVRYVRLRGQPENPPVTVPADAGKQEDKRPERLSPAAAEKAPPQQ